MLKLIVGPPGSGKTHYIADRITQDGVKPSCAPMLIVPEQSHFETELMIYRKAGPRLFGNTDIFSFTTLAGKITAEGGRNCVYASDATQEILMYYVLRELKDKLRFYKDVTAARMLGIMSMLQQEGLTPSCLGEAEAALLGRLKLKMSDLALIYENYNAVIGEEYNMADKQDEVRVAASLAVNTQYFRGRSIFLDGFDGFTGGQFLLLEAAITQDIEVTVTLTSDDINSQKPHYITTTKLIRKLTGIAKLHGVKTDAQILVYPGRKPYTTEVCELSDIYAEAAYTAAKIRELITAGEYTANEIAVLNAPSPETLSGALAQYGISAFIDLPQAIIEKPMVRFIITLLEAAGGSSQQPPGIITELISSGFVRLHHEQVRQLTRHAYEWQLENNDWFTPFPSGGKAEQIRAELTGKLTALSARLTGATGDKITEELTSFLIHDMELSRSAANIVYRGEAVVAELNDEYRSLWETVISILEAMHMTLKGRSISLSDYTAILRSVFSKTMTAKSPQVLDAVTVGDMRRSRINGAKVVFLMGANRNTFPSPSGHGGSEFTELEIEALCSAGVTIDESRTDRFYREKFLIHRALTLPGERLYITYPLRDNTFRELQPSPVLAGLPRVQAPDSPAFWGSSREALSFLSAQHKGVYAKALKRVLPHEHTRLFAGARKTDALHIIEREDAAALLKRESISPSRIERLNTCLFKYFCEQGLRIGAPRAINTAKPDALTRGNLIHYVLERVLRHYSSKNDNYAEFIGLDPADFELIAQKHIHDFEREQYNGYARSPRKRVILLRHAAGIAEVLRQMREDMEMSEFRPYALERQFSFMLGECLVKGTTDRLDVLVKNREHYVRVIDYKTGGKQFSYPEIELGLNLQVLIYLFASGEIGLPSGAFYRLVNGGRLTGSCKDYGAADAENMRDRYKNRMETQRTSGLQFGGITSDIERINQSFRSQLPATRKAFIDVQNLPAGDLNVLMEKAAKQLNERLYALHSGDVRAEPRYIGDVSESPCNHCDYKKICGGAI